MISIPRPKQAFAALFIAAMLSTVTSLAHAQVTAIHSRLLSRSVLPIGNTPDALGRYVSRRTLTKTELAAPMIFSVSLPFRNLAELRARVSNHDRITLSELDSKYFPLPSDYRRVANWLRAQGFKVGNEDPNHIIVDASGPVSMVSTAFQVAVGKVTTPDGQFTSAIDAPTIPASIANVVLGISGLQPYLRAHHCLIPCTNLTTSGSPGAHPPSYNSANFYMMTPADIRSLYNAPSNLTGSGQTIAVIMNAAVSASDLSTYNTYTGNSFTGTFTDVNVGTAPSNKNDNNSSVAEAAGDVESIAGIAPAANIRLYTIPGLDTVYVEDALNQIITDTRQNSAHITVISMSFSGPEDSGYTTNDLQTEDQLYLTTTALGITNVASSGDYGYLSKYFSQYVQEAGYPASDPYVTSVGGTTFHVDSTPQYPPLNVNNTIPSSSYIGETVLSLYPSSTPGGGSQYASAGNVSKYFSRPTWQTGNGTLLSTQTYRCVPDVAGPWGYIINHSSPSDTGSSNAIWEGTFGIIYTNIDSTTNVSQQIVEPFQGTSLAAPVFAGIVALINQNRGSNGPIGFLNPWLYEVGENTQWQAFHDLSGAYSNILWNGSSYTTYSNSNGEYTELPGYDLCTGLGTPNIANLASALQGNIYVVAPQNQTVTPGSTVVFSAFAETSPYLIAPATYQWYHNGTAISGATNAQLEISGSSTQLANSGDQYYCVVQLSNSQLANSTIQSQTATLTVSSTTNVGHVTGLSSRAFVNTGSDDLVGGLLIEGQGNMPIMMRAIGPTLATQNVANVLQDPKLTVYNGTPSVIATNYIWGGGSVLSNAFSALGLFALPANSTDSAILFANGQTTPALATGIYTAQVDGNTGDTGNALLEFYDANAAEGVTWTQGMPYLGGISARAYVGTGDSILVGGFIIAGSTSRTLLIRATGPSLAKYGISNPLADPQITLYNSQQTAFSSNEVWNGNPLIASAASAAGDAAWDSGSNDSAILVTLPPGLYTAQVKGATGDSGVALLEIYLVN